MNSYFILFLFVIVALLNKVSCDLSPPTPEPNQSTTPVQPGQASQSQTVPMNAPQSQPQGQPQDQGKPPLRCNQDDLITCLSGLANGPFANGGAIINSINETTFSQACMQLSNVKKCIAEKGKNCTEFDLIQFTGNLDSLNYVCNVNTPGYNKMQACLNDTTKKVSYLTNFYGCNSDLATFTPDLNITGQVCKQNNGMYSCYVNASKLCDATDFMINYYKIWMGSSITLMYQCNLNYSNWNTSQVYSECNTQKLAKCLANQTGMSNPLESFNMMSTSTNITSFCKSTADAKTCILKDAKCTDNEYMYGSTFLRANYYLCNDGKTGYDKLVKCYETNKSLFNSCMTIQPMDCASSNALHKCLVDSAKKTCGDGTFIQNYVYELLMPLAKTSNCILNLQIISPTNVKDGGQLGSQCFPVYVLLIVAVFISKFI